MRHRPAILLGASCIVALSAAACSSDAGSTASTTTIATPTSIGRADDGTLVVGAVLPTVGGASELGVSMTDALDLALSEINDAGGVLGKQVRLILREEGDNPSTAALAVQDLLQVGVDAIIGPTSSLNMLSTLGAVTEAGVLTCGPTTSALALDDFPDRGLFFRTIPSDSLQALALASLVEDSGSSSAAIVYLDDSYGRPFAEATEAAVINTGTRISAFVPFTAGEESVQSAVTAIVADDPDVVTVIADGATGPALITAIDEATDGRIEFVVNDAIRRPAADAQPFNSDLADRVTGVSPLARSRNDSFVKALQLLDPDADGLYAHTAYDCLNLIALAAEAADSTLSVDLAGAIPVVSSSGTACNSFTECNQALVASRNVDYDGPSGYLAIGIDGNVSAATFERFTFDESGRDIATGLLRVGDD